MQHLIDRSMHRVVEERFASAKEFLEAMATCPMEDDGTALARLKATTERQPVPKRPSE